LPKLPVLFAYSPQISQGGSIYNLSGADGRNVDGGFLEAHVMQEILFFISKRRKCRITPDLQQVNSAKVLVVCQNKLEIVVYTILYTNSAVLILSEGSSFS